MIKLIKSPEPQVLIDNGATWTAALLAKAAANQELTQTERTRYRHPEIKASLKSETNGKCAYCESKFGHVHHGDVEHIYPKSENLALSFVWNNLTLACEVCNQNKSNLDPYLNHIIDPYEVDPGNHLTFFGAIVMALDHEYGESTRTILGLARAELVERRNERLQKITSVFQLIIHQPLNLAAKKAIFQDLINVEIADSAEYAAMCRAAFNVFLGALDPQLREELQSVI